MNHELFIHRLRGAGVTTINQAAALIAMHKEGAPIGMTALSVAAGTSGAGATVMSDAFEKLGLAKRANNPRDRRSWTLGLTPGGHALFEEPV